MKISNDLLAHLKEAEITIKDWPAWKKDIWPDATAQPCNSYAEIRPATEKCNLVAELAWRQRHRTTI